MTSSSGGTGAAMGLERPCVVAFIDILGFREIMRSPDDEFRAKIIGLLEHLSSFSAGHGVSGQNLGVAFVGTCDPEVSTFSDNVVISVPIEVVHHNVPQGLQIPNDPQSFIANIFSIIISTIWEALHLGVLFRGAITVGRLHHRQNIVAGEALVDAVELEKSTRFPRVEVHKSVLDAMDSQGNPLIDDCTRAAAIKEESGRYFVDAFAWHQGVWMDYFHFRQQNWDPKKIVAAVHSIRRLLDERISALESGISLSDRLFNGKSLEPLRKWQWLRSEFERGQQHRYWQEFWKEVGMLGIADATQQTVPGDVPTSRART